MLSVVIKMKNKYIFHSHISEQKFREVIRYFALDIEISKIAVLTGISRQSLNVIIMAVRHRIAFHCEKGSPFESEYSKGEPVAGGFIIYNSCVCVQMIGSDFDDDVKALKKENVSDLLKKYSGVVDFRSWKYHRIEQGIGEADTFWSLTKARLTKFRGIRRDKLYYHLKESEYRYNHRNENLYPLLLKLCRDPALRLI